MRYFGVPLESNTWLPLTLRTNRHQPEPTMPTARWRDKIGFSSGYCLFRWFSWDPYQWWLISWAS
jgi:hypothetical protein